MTADPADRRAMVVFDVDDTLYLERDYVRSGFRAVGAAVGERGFFEAAWGLFLAGHRGDIFDRALAACHIAGDGRLVQELVQAYRTHVPDIRLLDDASSALRSLRAQGFGIGVITDGPADSQRAKVDALGLRALADVVILTGDYGPGFGKPHPRAYEEIEATSGCSEFTYVADNPAKDFETPARRGWHTVRVRRPGGLHAAVSAGYAARLTVTDLNQTAPLIPSTEGALTHVSAPT